MAAPIARLNDGSTHGGTIISAASNTKVDGKLVARVGDLHSCPIRGHGITPILNGSVTNVKVEGQLVALQGISVTGCGAVINQGSPDTSAT